MKIFFALLLLALGWLPMRFLQAAELPSIDSFSTDFISVTLKAPYETTIAVYGSYLEPLLYGEAVATLGPLRGTAAGGNSTGVNLNFVVDSSLLTKVRASYPLIITQEGQTILTTSSTITLFHPYGAKYKKSRVKKFLKNIGHKKQLSKQTLGMNVQWALAGNVSFDSQYENKLDISRTVWAREHFSYKLIQGEDRAAWFKRYDQILLNYRDQDIRVVGMLAYGSAENEFSPPSRQEWKNFVRLVVRRYRNYVDVWELWNEPDSPNYMKPNTWKAYQPLLEAGSSMIREYDKDALVLNGAISDITHRQFIKKLYTQGKKYFDELNVHLYYCEEYRDDGNSLTRLQDDWENLRALVKEYRKNDKIWITELGCSTGQNNISDELVLEYTKRASKLLRSYSYTRPILFYTFRDRPLSDAYEAAFGFLKESFDYKPIWRWYKLLPNLL